MGALQMFGYLCGAIIGAFSSRLGLVGLYIFMTIIFFLSTLITCTARTEPVSNFSPRFQTRKIVWTHFFYNDFYHPLTRNRDFSMLCLSRFLFQISIATTQQFLEYWITDCAPSSVQGTEAVSMALLPLLVIAPIGAFLIPKTRRKQVVYISTLFMTIACSIMIFVRRFEFSYLISSIFGLGFGPFSSVEFAMLME